MRSASALSSRAAVRTQGVVSGGRRTAPAAARRSLRVSMAAAKTPGKVVVLGGGIVGASIAYQLTRKGVTDVTVVERTAIAASSGGKGGGFLAGGWGDGSVTQDLHRRSFELHEQIAEELGLESYRKITTLSVRPQGRRGGKQQGGLAEWLDGDEVSHDLMDPSTAQVSPYELTTKMMAAAEAAGAKVVIGTCAGVQLSGDDAAEGTVPQLTGITLESGEVIECDSAVVAMGVWSTLLEDWGLGLAVPMEGVKSTSLVYKDMDFAKENPFALFCNEDPRFNTHLEVYPRPNGEVYICGCGGSDYVSGARLRKGGDCESAELIKEDPARVEAASAAFATMVSAGAKPPDKVQACMRPCPPDALPIMGKVPSAKGLYIAAGHNCWGILWAPITGLCMAELLADGESSVNLTPFAPTRFMTRAGGRGRRNVTQAVGEQW